MENGEYVCAVRHLEGHCGVILVSLENLVWSVKVWHELSYAWFIP